MAIDYKLKVFVDRGVPLPLAKEILRELNRRTVLYTGAHLDRNWKKLLTPLVKQIDQLQSSAAKRTGKPTEEFYKSYLALCIKAREKIRNAATIAALRGQTIQEAALERGIAEHNGRRWSVWIPQSVRTAFNAEYNILRADYPRIRMIPPFLTQMERTANDERWDILLQRIAVLKGMHPEDSGIHTFLNEALTIASQRTMSTDAPMQWAHILPKPMRDDFRKWQDDTLNGLRESGKDAEDFE
jgi:hypothetical protein